MTKITNTYHEWRKIDGVYEDIKGFCASVKLEKIQKHNFVLTPGRYVGILDEEDDGISFEEKMRTLTYELAEQMKSEEGLNEEIKKQLSNIGFNFKLL